MQRLSAPVPLRHHCKLFLIAHAAARVAFVVFSHNPASGL